MVPSDTSATTWLQNSLKAGFPLLGNISGTNKPPQCPKVPVTLGIWKIEWDSDLFKIVHPDLDNDVESGGQTFLTVDPSGPRLKIFTGMIDAFQDIVERLQHLSALSVRLSVYRCDTPCLSYGDASNQRPKLLLQAQL
jgi:hypothetical protein